MKLKKIASLMLAGIMAVSMLAGCNGKTDNKPNNGEENNQPAAGVSVDVGALTTKAPKYVTFADDADLDSALDYAMEWAGVKGILNNYVNTKNLTEVEHDVYNALTSKIITEGVEQEGIKEIGKINVWTDGDGATALEMFAVSSAIGENALNQKIADYLNGIVDEYRNYDKRGDNWYYDYTVSVSIDSKTVNSTGIGGVIGGIVGEVSDNYWCGIDGSVAGGIVGGSVSAENPSVTFVAIQVVRTARGQD